MRVLGRDGAAHGVETEGEVVSELLDLGGHGLGRRHDALDAGWRGAMVRALGLSGHDLQWVRGALGVGLTETAAGLSSLADRSPPRTATASVPILPAGRVAPSLSQAYRRLLGAVLPEMGVGLRGCLGVAYPGWVAYRNAAPAGVGQRALFRRWATSALTEPKRAEAIRLFDSAARDPVSRARDAFGAMQFREMRIGRGADLVPVAGYDLTPDTVAQARFPVRGGRLIFDSDRLVAAETGSLTHGGARRPSMLPGLCADAFHPLERSLATGRITVQGHIGARAVVPVAPGGWYDADLVQRAFAAGPCAAVWDAWASAGGWSAFFGAAGAMAHRASQLVLVSDVQLCWTCAGRFEKDDQARLLAALGLSSGIEGPLRALGDQGGGLWPFTVHAGQSAMRARAQFDAAGSLVVDLTLPPGRMQLWGVRVGHLAGEF